MDTGTRIRAAAVGLFASRGYAASSIRDIAKEAGVSNAAIYHFVDNKETLLVDIMREMQRKLTGATRTALDGVDAPEARLSILISGLAGAHLTSPKTGLVADTEVRALTPGGDAHTEIIALRDAYENLWRGTIQAGVDDGVFRVGNQRLTRLALLTMCSSAGEWYRPDGADDAVSIAREFVSLGLAAVRARRDGHDVLVDDVPLLGSADIPRADWEPREAPRPPGRER